MSSKRSLLCSPEDQVDILIKQYEVKRKEKKVNRYKLKMYTDELFTLRFIYNNL